MNWRWVSLASLLAATVIGYKAFIQRGTEQVANDALPPQPGYYLKDAVITRTRADGSPGVELIAERMEQQPGKQLQGDTINMTSVRVNYFAQDWRWTLTAERGEVPANSRVVYLEGDVELRPIEEGSNAWMGTDELAIDIEKNLAYSTRAPVHVRFGQHSMTVQQLQADLKQEKIRLESVNGRFEPQ